MPMTWGAHLQILAVSHGRTSNFYLQNLPLHNHQQSIHVPVPPMLASSTRVRARPLRPLLHQIRTVVSSSRLTADDLKPSNELAERLNATGLWMPTKKGRRRSDFVFLGDRHRVNIVSEELCGTYRKGLFRGLG